TAGIAARNGFRHRRPGPIGGVYKSLVGRARTGAQRGVARGPRGPGQGAPSAACSPAPVHPVDHLGRADCALPATGPTHVAARVLLPGGVLWLLMAPGARRSREGRACWA